MPCVASAQHGVAAHHSQIVAIAFPRHIYNAIDIDIVVTTGIGGALPGGGIIEPTSFGGGMIHQGGEPRPQGKQA